MNKTDYIKELEKRLKYIPSEDRQDAIEYYTELMSDMGIDDTEDVTPRLGTAKDAAKKILDECTQKHVEAYEEKKTIKGHATVVWLSVLGFLSLPVSLPLAIVVIALAVTIIAVTFALFISFAAASISLVVSGIASFVFMFWAPGFAQGAVVFGSGLAMIGIGVLLGIGLFFLVRLIMRKIFRRDKRENAVKEENI